MGWFSNFDYSKWKEVETVNKYALFMGYMSMAVRGMGYLVFLWTTVILLGGFVSALEKMDFWCLTIITLIQTVGVVGTVFLRKNVKKVVSSYRKGFVSTIYTFYIPKKSEKDKNNKNAYGNDGRMTINKKEDLHRRTEEVDHWWPLWLGRSVAFVAYLVQQLVFAVVAGPLVLAVTVLYFCGLVISTGLAAWRLLRRDYGGGGVNLQAALDVLYGLVLLQGVLSYYRLSSRFCERRLAHDVAKAYALPDPEVYRSNTQRWRYYTARDSLRRYIRETRIGCEKDPSFVKRWNLVKYAVDAMKEAETPHCSQFVHGASILDALLANPELQEQHTLIKEQVIQSPSAGDLLRKLLQLADTRRGYPKMYGVWVMAHLAGDLRPEQLQLQLPRGSDLFRCVASLVRVPGDDKDIGFDFLQDVAAAGLSLLGKLVAHDDGWCRAVADNEDMVGSVMVPLRCDPDHTRFQHGDTRSSRDYMRIRERIGASVQVLRRLVAAPGDAGEMVRRRISGRRDVMASMEAILRCDECDDCRLMEGALEIYTLLRGEDEPSIITTMAGHFIKRLVLIFVKRTTQDEDTILAGQMLAKISRDGKENTRIILEAKADVVNDLTGILEGKSTKCGIIAAQILEQLCIHHTDDDDDVVHKLKEHLKDKIPKILAETLPTNGEYYFWYERNREILEAVLSVIVAMSRNLMKAQDLAALFDAITSEDSAGFSILDKLNQLFEQLTWVITAHIMGALKLVMEVFILTARHGSHDATKHTRRLMGSLADAAKQIANSEDIMVLAGSCSGQKTIISLAEELRAAVDNLQRSREHAPEMAVVIDHPSSVNATQINY
ncbi:uncharacterized protein LOC102701322 [Oryza brachyantha]|uniref:uncharacterized protein LOC102701322 n=1 Tax=Oryza brachyantha TaxID=4533 RepID=UPI001ADC8FFB|nr:uncharacterized protein LOC102701322 [Oryza brachyantha]